MSGTIVGMFYTLEAFSTIDINQNHRKIIFLAKKEKLEIVWYEA